ncbi:MAG: hypothetical protein ACO1N5_10715 [Noviherbaspirillum sp.]
MQPFFAWNRSFIPVTHESERRDRIGRDRGYLERDLAQAERALADKLREIGK